MCCFVQRMVLHASLQVHFGPIQADVSSKSAMATDHPITMMEALAPAFSHQGVLIWRNQRPADGNVTHAGLEASSDSVQTSFTSCSTPPRQAPEICAGRHSCRGGVGVHPWPGPRACLHHLHVQLLVGGCALDGGGLHVDEYALRVVGSRSLPPPQFCRQQSAPAPAACCSFCRASEPFLPLPAEQSFEASQARADLAGFMF